MKQVDSATIKMISALIPALVLLLVDMWLRNRNVKDKTFLWLYLGLFCWVLSSGLAISPLKDFISVKIMTFLNLSTQENKIEDVLAYIFSPLNNIFFIFAAFNFARVKDDFTDNQGKKIYMLVTSSVLFLSLLTYFLFFITKSYNIAKYTDCISSLVVFLCLGMGLTYSFWKYDNQFLAGLSVVTITVIIVRQIVALLYHVPTEGSDLYLQISGNYSLGILFVALAVVWGLSGTSRLKIVGNPTNINVVALFFDIRKSTNWVEEMHGDTQVILKFMNEIRDWILKLSKQIMPAYKKPALIKFLGDGYLFVWERDLHNPGNEQPIHLALDICDKYEKFRDDIIRKKICTPNLPTRVGVGLDSGQVLKLTHENGSYDYIGGVLNNAAKFQGMARPNGGVVIHEDLYLQLGNMRLKSHFDKIDNLNITGDIIIKVRKAEMREKKGDKT